MSGACWGREQNELDSRVQAAMMNLYFAEKVGTGVIGEGGEGGRTRSLPVLVILPRTTHPLRGGPSFLLVVESFPTFRRSFRLPTYHTRTFDISFFFPAATVYLLVLRPPSLSPYRLFHQTIPTFPFLVRHVPPSTAHILPPQEVKSSLLTTLKFCASKSTSTQPLVYLSLLPGRFRSLHPESHSQFCSRLGGANMFSPLSPFQPPHVFG